ncbi:MAG: hypothetical protein IKW80_08315 [Thermoguttaceae bacterium]|nr:hypothetical protein [Thermoguttaceae bacterium]
MNKYDKAIDDLSHFMACQSMYLLQSDADGKVVQSGNFWQVVSFLTGYDTAAEVLKGHFEQWIVLNTYIKDYYNSAFPIQIIALVNSRLSSSNTIKENQYLSQYDDEYIELLFDLLLKYLDDVKQNPEERLAELDQRFTRKIQ